MSPPKTNKTAPSKPSGSTGAHSKRVTDDQETVKIISNPFESGKKRLIAGFLLAGYDLNVLQDIIHTLKLDATYSRPVDTSYTLAIIRELKKLALLDENGLVKVQYDQKELYNEYEQQYNEKIKALEASEDSLPTGDALEASGSAGKHNGEEAGNGQNKNLNNVGSPGQAKLDAAEKFLESIGVTVEQLNSKNNGGETVPPGQDELAGLTEAQRFQIK